MDAYAIYVPSPVGSLGSRGPAGPGVSPATRAEVALTFLLCAGLSYSRAEW